MTCPVVVTVLVLGSIRCLGEVTGRVRGVGVSPGLVTFLETPADWVPTYLGIHDGRVPGSVTSFGVKGDRTLKAAVCLTSNDRQGLGSEVCPDDCLGYGETGSLRVEDSFMIVDTRSGNIDFFFVTPDTWSYESVFYLDETTT